MSDIKKIKPLKKKKKTTALPALSNNLPKSTLSIPTTSSSSSSLNNIIPQTLTSSTSTIPSSSSSISNLSSTSSSLNDINSILKKKKDKLNPSSTSTIGSSTSVGSSLIRDSTTDNSTDVIQQGKDEIEKQIASEREDINKLKYEIDTKDIPHSSSSFEQNLGLTSANFEGITKRELAQLKMYKEQGRQKEFNTLARELAARPKYAKSSSADKQARYEKYRQEVIKALEKRGSAYDSINKDIENLMKRFESSTDQNISDADLNYAKTFDNQWEDMIKFSVYNILISNTSIAASMDPYIVSTQQIYTRALSLLNDCFVYYKPRGSNVDDMIASIRSVIVGNKMVPLNNLSILPSYMGNTNNPMDIDSMYDESGSQSRKRTNTGATITREQIASVTKQYTEANNNDFASLPITIVSRLFDKEVIDKSKEDTVTQINFYMNLSRQLTNYIRALENSLKLYQKNIQSSGIKESAYTWNVWTSINENNMYISDLSENIKNNFFAISFAKYGINVKQDNSNNTNVIYSNFILRCCEKIRVMKKWVRLIPILNRFQDFSSGSLFEKLERNFIDNYWVIFYSDEITSSYITETSNDIDSLLDLFNIWLRAQIQSASTITPDVLDISSSISDNLSVTQFNDILTRKSTNLDEVIGRAPVDIGQVKITKFTDFKDTNALSTAGELMNKIIKRNINTKSVFDTGRYSGYSSSANSSYVGSTSYNPSSEDSVFLDTDNYSSDVSMDSF